MAVGASLALGISALALYAVIKSQGDAGWATAVSQARPAYLALCLFLLAASWVADAMRLRALGVGLGHRLGLGPLVATIMMGNFLTLATPFMIGGAPALIYVVHRQGLALGQASAMIVLGGVAAQVALAGFNLLAALVLAGQLPAGAWLGRAYFAFVLTYFAALGLFIVLAVRFDRLRPRLEALRRRRQPQYEVPAVGPSQARDGGDQGLVARAAGMLISLLSDFRVSLVHLTGRGFRHLAAATGWAACYFLLYFAVGLGVLLALDIRGHLPSLFAWQVVASTIALFTPSPGGSGAAELGAMYAFGGMLSSAALPAFVVLWRILTFHLNLLLGAAATAWWAHRLARQEGGASAGE